MSTILLIALTIVCLWIEFIYQPRLDRTAKGELLLWYNSGLNRNFKVLWK